MLNLRASEKRFIPANVAYLMRPTLIPVKLRLGNNFHNVIYLWSESWGDTDDWFYVWEGDEFKPYHHVRVLPLKGKDIYPEYHYKEEEFKQYLKEFLDELPLLPVIYKDRLGYLITQFENEYWIYRPITNKVIVTAKKPKPYSLGANKDVIKKALEHYIIHGISPRIVSSDIHLHHLIVISGKKVRK